MNTRTLVILGASCGLVACTARAEGIDEAADDVADEALVEAAAPSFLASSSLEAGGATAPLPGETVGDPLLLADQALADDGQSQAEEDQYVAQGDARGAHELSDRSSHIAYKFHRGSTVSVSESIIARLCGDIDGCTLRMGMYDWDGQGRVASRENLFFYNTVNRAWRAMVGDPSGSDYNGVTEHIMQAWACYFTDGYYLNWANYGDGSVGFGLLSWNEYNADCWLTIID